MSDILPPDEPAAAAAAQGSSRLALLSTCLRGESTTDRAGETLAELLSALRTAVDVDLPALFRQGSPDDIVDIHGRLVRALDELHQSCTLPPLGGKWVVGFGGAFSAGKSSLINALLGAPLLPVELDPTTSIATCITHGDEDDVLARNVLGQRVRLSDEDLRSLSHDEARVHGSEIARLIESAVIVRREFPWRHLALADTPGYSKPEFPDGDPTDADRARARLNASDAIVWVVSADNGGINDSDLRFLATLDTAIPKLIALSRADRKSASDVEDIVSLIRRTLAERNIDVLDVVPVSRRRAAGYPLTPLTERFDGWNARRPAPPCPREFKLALRTYAAYLTDQRERAFARMGATNRALALIDANDASMPVIQAINDEARQDMERFAHVAATLEMLTRSIFDLLEKLGDAIGTPMCEPDEVELLGEKRFALIARLSESFQRRGASIGAGAPSNQIIGNNRHAEIWKRLDDLPEVCDVSGLLRRNTNTAWLNNLN